MGGVQVGGPRLVGELALGDLDLVLMMIYLITGELLMLAGLARPGTVDVLPRTTLSACLMAVTFVTLWPAVMLAALADIYRNRP